MSGLLKKIPLILIWLRLFFAAVIILLSVFKPDNYRLIMNVLLITGIVSDIFDGIIARKLHVSTVMLRRLDSAVDQVFWLSALIAAYMLCKDFFIAHQIKLLLLLAGEGMTYLVSYIKFRKEVATHAILSKVWTLTILATLVQVIASCSSTWIFTLCFYTGMITRLEVIGIILVLRKWENDIPGIYQAIQIRKGKPISRNKLFNG